MVIYARVSKAARGERGGETRSVDQQIARETERATTQNATVVAVHRDDGISASRHGRTVTRDGWQQTMTLIVDGQVDELWTWEISRATRDRPVWATLVTACIASHVLISVDGRLHDPTDPDDGFMLDLQAALAVREAAVTSKRIAQDVAARAKAGQPHGKIPYGYMREYDLRTGALLRQIPDPEIRPEITRMVRRILDHGWTTYRVAHDLNDRGVPAPEVVRQARAGRSLTGVMWTPEQVRQILISPTLAGLRLHNGVVVAEATWPGVISPGDHTALRALFLDPSRRTYRDRATKHLLSGIAECGVCGARCRRAKNRGYPSYACQGKGGRGDSCVARLQHPVDMFVTEAVLAYMGRPDIAVQLAPPDTGASASAAAIELADLRGRLRSFIASAAAGGISADTLAELETQLRPLIADAQRRATPPDLPAPVAQLVVPDPAAVWEDMSVPDRRQVVRHLVRVVILPSTARRGSRGFDPTGIDLRWRAS